MKSSNKILKPLSMIMMLCIGLVLFTSCSSDDDNDAPPPEKDSSIAEIVSSNPDFSILKDAVVKAGLAETLDDEGHFTVFAPDNDAFEAAGLGSSDLNDLSAEVLKNILLYHTLDSKVKASDVPAGPNAAVETMNEDSVYLTSNDQGVFVNGIMVKQADIEASNGVIHVVSNVLMPPSGNIVETAQVNDDLSFLVAAVVRASEGDTDVATLLSSDGPFTVFAPTNQAFMDAGFESISDIQNANPDDLAAILTYHVVDGRVFSSDLMDDQEVPMLNEETTTIGLDETPTIKGMNNDESSNIVMANIVTTNGVVHVIDRVLLP